jgi:hypothetical protein
MKNKIWTELEEIELDHFYRQQLTFNELAKKFSCTVAEIKRKLKETEDLA